MSAVTGGLVSVRPRRTTGWLPGHRAAAVVVMTGALAFGAAQVVDAMQDAAGRAEHMQFAVAEGGVVRVFYDLVADNPQQLLGVRLLISRDGGQTFDLTPSTVSGDVGPAIAPGPGKRIIWESARDVERLDIDRLRVRVVVSVISVSRTPPSFWGVSASLAPDWRMASGPRTAFFAERVSDYRVAGAEFRIGIVRGRTESGDWGFAVVRKMIKRGSFVAKDTILGQETTTTYRVTEGAWLTGVEVYKFLPFLKVGGRQQFGVVLAAGASGKPGGTVERRIEGIIFASDPSLTPNPPVVTRGPGFMYDDWRTVVAVPSGQTSVVDRVDAWKLVDVSVWSSTPQVLARAELAWAVTLRSDTKIRVSGGVNFPGFQVFSIEMVHLLGR